jgi:hypothetical protein
MCAISGFEFIKILQIILKLICVLEITSILRNDTPGFFFVTDRTFEVGRLLVLCHCLHAVVRIPADGILKQGRYTEL